MKTFSFDIDFPYFMGFERVEDSVNEEIKWKMIFKCE